MLRKIWDAGPGWNKDFPMGITQMWEVLSRTPAIGRHSDKSLCHSEKWLKSVTAWCRKFIMNSIMVPLDQVRGSQKVEKLHRISALDNAGREGCTPGRDLSLLTGKEVSNHSKLRCLSLFLDDESVFRVGVQLKSTPFSPCSYQK